MRNAAIRIPGLLAAALALASVAPSQPAAQKGAPEPLYIVTYVDVFPNFAADTARALEQFVTETRKDPGCLRIEAFRDIERSNHFTVLDRVANLQRTRTVVADDVCRPVKRL